MKKLAIFQFKSITHRLIFGCVVSAIGIYGISYWHARQLMQKTAGTWIVDLTQSRIDNATHDMESKLLGIERNVLLLMPTILQTEQNSDTVPNDELLLSLKFLVERQPEVQTVALIEMPNSPTETFPTGWNYDRQGKYSNLNGIEARGWLTRCDRAISSNQPSNQTSNQTLNQSFWSQPHASNTSLSNGLAKSSITYCIPLATDLNIANALSSNPRIRYLAVELDLDWLSTLIAKQFTNTDEINYLELVDPFVVTSSGTQWLVKPKNSQQVQSWLSQQNLHDISLHQGLIYTKVNPQGTLITKTAPSSDWIVGIIFPSDKLEQFQQKYLWSIIFSMSKDMVLMCVVVALISQLTTKPLRALNASTEEMAKGNLDTTLPEVTSNDEVGRLTHSFRRMRDSLQLHIQDLQETTAAKQKLESELSIAAQIQRTMLPRTSVQRNPISPYDISAVLRPARIVGGDLYDFFLLGSDRLCLIIGDVADKGFPSALQMAKTITLIRTLTKASSTPSEILSTVNQELCAENEDCLFVTVFCGALELSTGKFTYSSGGHDAPILVRDRHVQYLDLETMPPLGLYEDSVFEQQEFTLLPNDLIVFYTDGITEAMNANGEIFSESRLIEMMTSYPPTNTTRAVRTIQHFCQQFVADAPQSDDITLLAVQYLPSNPFSQVANVMEWKLTLNSVLTELEQVKQTLGKILREADLTVEIIEDAQLIAEEILVNIIQYGYEGRSDGHIDLRIEMNDQNLSMTFEDSAKPFNPLTDITTPDLEKKDDNARSRGGFGFFLVQELAEQVDYVYRDGKNTLTVSQRIVAAISI
ncbi:serine phosphatase RsbU, regulator of sigma subunit [Pseudanabaena sp. lw0831]|uniref:SpoIIE family protein phosphatase n=1 Tax=Pseudanabaena sp. lw0831 TaxID=1357935 RepID=UPI001915D0AD|nr:SpoIIE family protein phosphatase [Pseudanabaena sp. lw0831]GBO52625.1 serine phosphatase RsbU, regulator of sigma subunit [Pseudanabaena sp. lw0831]